MNATGEPYPEVRPLAGPVDGAPAKPSPKPSAKPSAKPWRVACRPAEHPAEQPEAFLEILRDTREGVGQDGFAYDGAVAAAEVISSDPRRRRLHVALYPVSYSEHLASRRYGERHGYTQAPHKAAIASVLLATAEGLWVLAQRSGSVDISKGKIGFSAGGFLDPDLVSEEDAFGLAAVRELEEELGVTGAELSSLSPSVLIHSWRKVEVSHVARTPLTLDEVRARALRAAESDEHQRLLGVPPAEHAQVLDRYGTWPGVREALARALATSAG